MTERQGNTSFVREEGEERKASGEKEKNKGNSPKRKALTECRSEAVSIGVPVKQDESIHVLLETSAHRKQRGKLTDLFEQRKWTCRDVKKLILVETWEDEFLVVRH